MEAERKAKEEAERKRREEEKRAHLEAQEKLVGILKFVSVLEDVIKQKEVTEQKISSQNVQTQSDEEMHIDGCDIIFLGKIYHSKKALAEDFGISPATFHNRLKKGWSCKQALGFEEYIPPKAYFQGIEYESEKAMAEAFGIEFYSYRSKLALGWTQEEALGITLRKKTEASVEEKIEFRGKEYETERELAAEYGVNYTNYKNRIRFGWTREEALEIIPRKKPEVTMEEKIIHLGKEYKTERDLAKDYGVKYLNYKRRLQHGWTREEALEVTHRYKTRNLAGKVIDDGRKNFTEPIIKKEDVSNNMSLVVINNTLENETNTECNSVEAFDKKQKIWGAERKNEFSENFNASGVANNVSMNELGSASDLEIPVCIDISVLGKPEDKVSEEYLRQLFGKYYDEFSYEWTKATTEILEFESRGRKSFIASLPLERKISHSCQLSHETIPWNHAKSSAKELNLEYSCNECDCENSCTIVQANQIQNLLFYLRYATVGKIDLAELASAAGEVYEWLCLNVGYNKHWKGYSITEYAGKIYDDITSLQSGINESQIGRISQDIVHLIFRINEYFNLDGEEINRYFADEWNLQEEYEPGDLEADSVFERSVLIDRQKELDDIVSATEYFNNDIVPEERSITYEGESDWILYKNVNQEEIIQSSPSERTIVNAGPGTGKTWTLIEKIKYLLTEEWIDPEGILVLCFSRAAVEVVRTRLSDASERGELPADWHMVDVRTFDSFSTYMIAWVQENMPELLPWDYVLEKEDYEMRVRTAREVLEEYPDMLAQYEHIFVDEVQDLVGNRAELVLSLLCSLPETCGFTLFGDSCQALYDYLAENDDSVMTSEEFYRQLIQYFSDADFCSLKKNHRQGDRLAGLSIPYRDAILSGKSEECAKAAKALYEAIEWSDIDLKHFSKEKMNRYIASGTLGILTRTNGQALQISSWMKNKGIRHVLQKPITSKDLAGWIGSVLLKAETDVIDRNEFIGIFSELYPEERENAVSYWYALTDTQRGQNKKHYEIEDLLKGLLQNARNPLLFDEPSNDENMVTVSNIHRAKGREFDTVILLDDVISSMTRGDSNLEHKVCYVAVTRPRKKLEKVAWSNQYIYISKDEQRRCFKAGNYLSEYEVGYSSDFEQRTFGESSLRQSIIKSALKPGKRLRLLKCAEGTKDYVMYKLVMEIDEYSVLGYTSPQFARGVKKAIQRIFHTYRDISFGYYPDMFVDIYVDGLTTCISADGENIDGARRFGKMYLWNGLSVSGFARINRKIY